MADEIISTSESFEENRLIRRPYLDRLADLQYQKNLGKKELEKRLN